MQEYWDIVIIGAGPAGMSAAIAASKQDCRVLVLDRQTGIGGQIYCGVEKASDSQRRFLGKDYAKGVALAQAFRNSDAVLQLETTVWGIEQGALHVSCGGASRTIHAGQIIIATGAKERPTPVEGWTLPGVMGAGAADIMLKNSGMAVDGPVALCGNGPLLLQAAAHLKKLKIPVAGIVSTSSLQNYRTAAPRLPLTFGRPLYYAKGAAMVGSILTASIPRFSGAHNVAIERNEAHGLSVSFSSKSKRQSLEAQTVMLHEGVIPETRLTRLAGCKHDWNATQRYLFPRRTVWGESTVEGIRIAGDGGSVFGAEAAALQGTLTGLDCCRALGKIDRNERDTLARSSRMHLRRIAASQYFMDAFFAPSIAALSPSDQTIVCRCEELTAGTIRKYIRSGCLTPDGVKAQSRSGMGQCQGGMCEHAVLELIAQERGIDPDLLEPYKVQAPLYPLSLGELAEMNTPSS